MGQAALDHLTEHGYVILPELLGRAEREALVAALEPYERGRPMGRNGFEGERTHRVYSLAGKGDAFQSLAEHPAVLGLLDQLLAPNYLLSTLQSIRLHPGETPQPWHTDDGFYPIARPRTRLAISTIWAIEAFTEDNGATQVIPGSHLWGPEHPDDRSHTVVPVVMPPGSVVIFDGALWHRGGENRSGASRLAVSPQYCQPWLRPQESQLLVVPPERATTCSARVLSLLGYSIHPPFIGQVDGMNPLRLVHPDQRGGNRRELSAEASEAERFLKRPTS
jgi:ectoine hydroxylase-related dioxygenase (phytanoyl-CoA dioxygenase family)